MDRLAHNWIGKPISDVRDKRLKALQAAEQNAHVDGHASDDRVTEARLHLTRPRVAYGRFHVVMVGRFGYIVGSSGMTQKQPQAA